MELTEVGVVLTKHEVDAWFERLFEEEGNGQCFECGKKSKQWAEMFHGLFLCLNCAALYREVKGAVRIKSVGLDIWTKGDLMLLERGGNRRFRQFLRKYELGQMGYRDKLRTKASVYYRGVLECEGKGELATGQPPSVQNGRLVARGDISLSDMTAEEMLLSAKEKAFWLGGKTKQLGVRAVTKVQQKVTSGELKSDVKKVAEKVGVKAKRLWGFVKQLGRGDKQQ